MPKSFAEFGQFFRGGEAGRKRSALLSLWFISLSGSGLAGLRDAEMFRDRDARQRGTTSFVERLLAADSLLRPSGRAFATYCALEVCAVLQTRFK
jgi:hypothetical protein